MGASLFSFLLIAGAVQGFIFNAATLFFIKRIDKTVVYLNLVVFFLSLNNLQAWLIDNGYVSDIYYIKYLLVPWYVLVFPMFYSFLLHYLKIEKKFRTFIVVSLCLFTVELIVRSGIIGYMYYSLGPEEGEKLIAVYNNVEEMINAAYCVFIFVKALLVVYRYQSLYEYMLQYDDISWLKWFLTLGTIIVLLWLTAIFLNNTVSFIQAPYSYYPLRLGSSVLLYWIGYHGFFRYIMVKNRISLRKRLLSPDRSRLHAIVNNGPNKVAKNTNQSDKQAEVFNNINDYILEKQRYLDPKLSLEVLAQEREISTSQLSLLINNYSSFNFSDYINNFRVAQAKKLLANKEFDKYTILSIGLECGFNSRSTFYAAFKKFTSQTPTVFRKRVQKE